MRTTAPRALTSHTRCRPSLNTIRRPSPESGGSTVSGATSSSSSRPPGAVSVSTPSPASLSVDGALLSELAAVDSSAWRSTVFAAGEIAPSSADSAADGSAPTPPSTARIVTDNEAVATPIRPYRGRTCC